MASVTRPLRIGLFRPSEGMKVIETFLTSFRLKNTYRANGIIYSLKSIPVINGLLPFSLYGSPGLKRFANFVSILWELVSMFLGKLFYMFILVFLLKDSMKTSSANSFMHMFFFLTIAGGFLNTQIFRPHQR